MLLDSVALHTLTNFTPLMKYCSCHSGSHGYRKSHVLVNVLLYRKMPWPQKLLFSKKHLIGPCLQFLRFSSIFSWCVAWRHAGRYGAAEKGQEFYICIHRKREESDTGCGLSYWCENLNPVIPFKYTTPQWPNFLK